MNHDTIELACIGVAALALFVQTVILLALYRGMTKAAQSIKEEIEDLRSSVMPVVDSTRELVGSTREMLDSTRALAVRVGPKVETAVTDVAELARVLREQAADVEALAGDVLERVRKQTARIDAMVSGTLDSVDKASAFVTEAVARPVRQLSGLLAGVKAIVESLRSTEAGFREPGVHDDKDMFV
jgi:uncharacterized protein YoxC